MLNAKTGKCVFRRILRVFCLLCSFIATIDKINSNKRKNTLLNAILIIVFDVPCDLVTII